MRRPRARLIALALVLLVVVAGASAVVVERERFRAKFDQLARSLGFTGEDELAERFTRSTLAGSSSVRPTALQFGPDGRLYVAQQDGLVKAYTIARDDRPHVPGDGDRDDLARARPPQPR